MAAGVVAWLEPQGRFVLRSISREQPVRHRYRHNAVTAATNVVKDPDQIVFTQRYAYVRGIESEKFTLSTLREARMGNWSRSMCKPDGRRRVPRCRNWVLRP